MYCTMCPSEVSWFGHSRLQRSPCDEAEMGESCGSFKSLKFQNLSVQQDEIVLANWLMCG